MGRKVKQTQPAAISVKMTDAELLRREFVERDPEGLTGLRKTLPDDYLDAEIEFWYDLTPPRGTHREYVWCAHDRRRTHWKGYVMVTPSGARFLLGKDCGLEVFDFDFASISKDFDQARSRQRLLVRRLSGLKSLDPAIHAINRFCDHHVLGQFEMIQNNLLSELPSLRRALVDAVTKREGRLFVRQKQRDLHAEHMRAERYAEDDEELARAEEMKNRGEMTVTAFKRFRDGFKFARRERDVQPIFRFDDVPMGQLAGAAMITSGPKPRDVIRLQMEKMRLIGRELQTDNTESLSNRILSVQLRRLIDCIDKIESEKERLLAPLAFFGERNLNAVARWASHVPSCGGEYRAGRRKIVLISNGGNREISLPSNYEVPEIQELDDLVSALTRSHRSEVLPFARDTR